MAVYTLVVIALGTGERIVEAFRTEGSLVVGFDSVLASAKLRHFLGLVLLIRGVVGRYAPPQEIDSAMGKGALLRLLFERPAKK